MLDSEFFEGLRESNESHEYRRREAIARFVFDRKVGAQVDYTWDDLTDDERAPWFDEADSLAAWVRDNLDLFDAEPRW